MNWRVSAKKKLRGLCFVTSDERRASSPQCSCLTSLIALVELGRWLSFNFVCAFSLRAEFLSAALTIIARALTASRAGEGKPPPAMTLVVRVRIARATTRGAGRRCVRPYPLHSVPRRVLVCTLQQQERVTSSMRIATSSFSEFQSCLMWPSLLFRSLSSINSLQCDI